MSQRDDNNSDDWDSFFTSFSRGLSQVLEGLDAISSENSQERGGGGGGASSIHRQMALHSVSNQSNSLVIPSSSSSTPTQDERRRRRQQQEAENAVAVVAVGAAVAAGGYLLYKGLDYLINGDASSSTESTPTTRQRGTVAIRDSPPTLAAEYSSADNTIVIAVDATPGRAGGLLRFPRTETIYFYSIDWSRRFDFTHVGPDKFEMANVFLALELFEEVVTTYRLSNSRQARDLLVCKNDSNIWLSEDSYRSGLRNRKFRELFQRIQETLGSPPFSGQGKHVMKQTDGDLKIADKLSRTAVHTSDNSLPVIPGFNYCGYDYSRIRNLSSSSAYALDALEVALE